MVGIFLRLTTSPYHPFQRNIIYISIVLIRLYINLYTTYRLTVIQAYLYSLLYIAQLGACLASNVFGSLYSREDPSKVFHFHLQLVVYELYQYVQFNVVQQPSNVFILHWENFHRIHRKNSQTCTLVHVWFRISSYYSTK